MVRMTRAAAVMVVMAVELRVTCFRALKRLVGALDLSVGALMEVISWPVPPGVGFGSGFLAGTLTPMPMPMPMPAPVHPYVRLRGQPQGGGSVQGWWVGPGGGDESGPSRAPPMRSGAVGAAVGGQPAVDGSLASEPRRV
mgnify:CR=1 FL=1